MDSIKQTIKNYSLINAGEIIGVACSGGADSMSLLHFLNENKEDYDIEVVAININHNIRDNSSSDSAFVSDYCKEHHIKCYKFNLDVFKLMQERSLTLEEAARVARYTMFDSLLSRGIVDKIALGHHISDQVETVLLNIFRGTGLNGASGINFVRGKYIRPLLNSTKDEILAYIHENELSYVDDETNFENDASRNYLRNTLMPIIRKKWPNVEQNILSFSKICKNDDEFIKSQMHFDAVIKDSDNVKIPLSYFIYSNSLISRLVMDCFEHLKVQKDMERKHISMVLNLALNGENGNKINLPNNVTVHKEYDFLTIVKKVVVVKNDQWKFKCGKTTIPDSGIITVKKLQVPALVDGSLVIDFKKLPKNAVWRFRQDGDVFTKFGGGTKKLKSVMADKKIPLRLRNTIPVLAVDNEIFVIAGIEISDKVKIDNTTSVAYAINFENKI